MLGPAKDCFLIERVTAIRAFLHLATNALAFGEIVGMKGMAAKAAIELWAKDVIGDDARQRYHSLVQVVYKDRASPNVRYLCHTAGKGDSNPIGVFEQLTHCRSK
ncbi:MAG: hypothetical protein CMJ58_28395 [Planctomycetaceae bacterium]|nr:hypothetical protein [Planctomycetaceae bacterium]